MADNRFDIDKFIADADKAYIQANITEIKAISTSVYVVSPRTKYRLDLISAAIYGTSNLKWVLIYVNDIIDVSVLDFGYKLYYPTLKDILSVLFKTIENIE